MKISKSTILIICLAGIISACNAFDIDVTKDLELNIRNLTNSPKSLKVTTRLAKKFRLIPVSAKDTINYVWRSPVIEEGEGDFEFMVDGLKPVHSGYYTNGYITVDEPFWVTITNDSVTVNLGKF